MSKHRSWSIQAHGARRGTTLQEAPVIAVNDASAGSPRERLLRFYPLAASLPSPSSWPCARVTLSEHHQVEMLIFGQHLRFSEKTSYLSDSVRQTVSCPFYRWGNRGPGKQHDPSDCACPKFVPSLGALGSAVSPTPRIVPSLAAIITSVSLHPPEEGTW